MLLTVRGSADQHVGRFDVAVNQAGLMSGTKRSRKAADLYRDAYEQRRDQFGVIIDRALERGELATDLNRALFLDSLPALLVRRVITNQPLPPIDQVPALIDGIIRSLDEARDAALG